MSAQQDRTRRNAIGLIVVLALLIIFGLILLLVTLDADGRPDRPPPPTALPPIQSSLIEAGEGITCVRVHQGERTLHWQCFKE